MSEVSALKHTKSLCLWRIYMLNFPALNGRARIHMRMLSKSKAGVSDKEAGKFHFSMLLYVTVSSQVLEVNIRSC